MSVRHAIEGFGTDQRRRGLSPATIQRRAYSLRAFGRWLEPLDLFQATSDHVERFLDGRSLTARGRYVWLSNLHSFYSWAIRNGQTTDDPTAEIVRPRLRRNLPRPIADVDLAAVLAGADPQHRAALTLAAYAGLRCGEIATLERAQLDEQACTIRVVGKGGHERVVPMHPEVWTAARSMGLPRTGRLFRRSNGAAFTGSQMSAWLNRYLHDGIGVDATAHQLRHWFGSKVYAAGRDLRAVQELLGHASPTTTAGYTALVPGVSAEMVLRLPILGSSDPCVNPTTRGRSRHE